MRHSRATLQPLNVPQQFCATPLGNITASKCSPTEPRDTLGRRYKPISFPNSSARHPRATLCHFFVAETYALIPSRINSETTSALPTPLGDITSLYRSTTGPRDTLGRRYKPTSFPNRAARHPRATLQPQNVPQQFCAAPLGNALPLFRRWRVRIDPVSNKPGDTFGTAHTLGRRYKPISFHNRAARHSRATLQPLNVPQQFCATPLGNTLPLFRRRNVRIDPVMNMLRDSFGTAYTLGRRFKPTSFHNRAVRHSRATLQPQNVPQQFCATPLGDITSLYRSPTGSYDTLGRHYSP